MCTLATRPFIEALGTAVAEEPLPEMYAAEDARQEERYQ